MVVGDWEREILDVCLDICLWSILLESTVTRSRFEPGSPKAQIGTYNGERELLSKRHGYFSGILGPVAQWIRHLTTNQGIPGSSPGRIGSFDLPKMRPQWNVTVPRTIVRNPRPMEIRHKCILFWLKIHFLYAQNRWIGSPFISIILTAVQQNHDSTKIRTSIT